MNDNDKSKLKTIDGESHQVEQTVSYIDFLDYETGCQSESKDFIRRLQRTIKILIAAGFISEEKIEQAYEISSWD